MLNIISKDIKLITKYIKNCMTMIIICIYTHLFLDIHMTMKNLEGKEYVICFMFMYHFVSGLLNMFLCSFSVIRVISHDV